MSPDKRSVSGCCWCFGVPDFKPRNSSKELVFFFIVVGATLGCDTGAGKSINMLD
jgi:hypothetical protein